MDTPGATKSGLTRLSRDGPSEEKLATEPLGLVVDAPTDNTFFPVEGANTLEAFCSGSSPAENIGRNSGLS